MARAGLVEARPRRPRARDARRRSRAAAELRRAPGAHDRFRWPLRGPIVQRLQERRHRRHRYRGAGRRAGARRRRRNLHLCRRRHQDLRQARADPPRRRLRHRLRRQQRARRQGGRHGPARADHRQIRRQRRRSRRRGCISNCARTARRSTRSATWFRCRPIPFRAIPRGCGAISGRLRRRSSHGGPRGQLQAGPARQRPGRQTGSRIECFQGLAAPFPGDRQRSRWRSPFGRSN